MPPSRVGEIDTLCVQALLHAERRCRSGAALYREPAYTIHQKDITMSHLLTLPTELLIEIFAVNDMILDALNLSATIRCLNAIWLEHYERVIIERIPRPSLPAYDEAVQVAFLETRLESPTNDPSSLRTCLPLLLRNADLCASACLAYSIAQKEAISPPASYYFLCRAGLGFIHY